MDLSVAIDATILNVRVAVLLNTPNGYVFEKERSGYLFPVGGRVQVNETSSVAAVREVFEEIGLSISVFNLNAIAENFFKTPDGRQFHEICFFYKADVGASVELPENFVLVREAELEKFDIRPAIVASIIDSKTTAIIHYVENHH